jgi:hypothetical protein
MGVYINKIHITRKKFNIVSAGSWGGSEPISVYYLDNIFYASTLHQGFAMNTKSHIALQSIK